jgi:hypothetical protein
MPRCRAKDVFEFLSSQGYQDQGDRFSGGVGLLHHGGAILMLPAPEFSDGDYWYDAHVIMDILANRWVWQGTLPFEVYD